MLHKLWATLNGGASASGSTVTPLGCAVKHLVVHPAAQSHLLGQAAVRARPVPRCTAVAALPRPATAQTALSEWLGPYSDGATPDYLTIV